MSDMVRLSRWLPVEMPELPDITVYCECLGANARGNTLMRVRLASPFLLRTAVPPLASVEGRQVVGTERLGKRIVVALEGELFLVLHLMIAGRLHWHAAGGKPPSRTALATFAFDAGTLALTEAGTQRRASLHLAAGRDALHAMDPGGIDVMCCSRGDFAMRLAVGNHTLKRTLTDPKLFSGIGNAYADEILHHARMSPLAMSRSLDDDDKQRLLEATRAVMGAWTDRLRANAARHAGWPPKVTAFHPDMAVHGRYGLPCPVCASKVQRIVHGAQASSRASRPAVQAGAGGSGVARRSAGETNYCPRCQTGGRLLADRSLSRLLHASWPDHIDDM
jgi:formamidopyrimidine-DNA glycosylase